MEIHIGNLSPGTTVYDLNNMFGLPADPPQCRVFRKVDRDGRVFHYAIVIVRSDAAGQRLIKRFNNTVQNGKRLELHEVQPRRIGNERRALNWRIKAWNGSSRRNAERRVALGDGENVKDSRLVWVQSA
jgi:RNA recognition motif-containing protein